jgi:hypothetical protein
MIPVCQEEMKGGMILIYSNKSLGLNESSNAGKKDSNVVEKIS